MRLKTRFRLLGWVTFIVFPLIGWALLYIFEGYDGKQIMQSLELDHIFSTINLIGLELGLLYGFLVLFISQAPMFEEFSKPQTQLIQNLKLNFFDVLFISIAAGFGEEILFRVALQTWLGPWFTSFLFIAIHGYFSLKVFKKNILGVLLFPFILILAYSYEEIGLWFCVSAHFSYDFLMFFGVLLDSKKQQSSTTE